MTFFAQVTAAQRSFYELSVVKVYVYMTAMLKSVDHDLSSILCHIFWLV